MIRQHASYRPSDRCIQAYNENDKENEREREREREREMESHLARPGLLQQVHWNLRLSCLLLAYSLSHNVDCTFARRSTSQDDTATVFQSMLTHPAVACLIDRASSDVHLATEHAEACVALAAQASRHTLITAPVHK